MRPVTCRLPRSWPLFDHTADAWGAAQTALQALWPPDGRGMSWALLFVALLALAGLYEGAVFLTERLWGVRPSEGLRSKEGGGKQERKALLICFLLWALAGCKIGSLSPGHATGGERTRSLGSHKPPTCLARSWCTSRRGRSWRAVLQQQSALSKFSYC